MSRQEGEAALTRTLLERKRVKEKRAYEEKSATSQLMRSYHPSGVFLTARILWFGW